MFLVGNPHIGLRLKSTAVKNIKLSPNPATDHELEEEGKGVIEDNWVDQFQRVRKYVEGTIPGMPCSLEKVRGIRKMLYLHGYCDSPTAPRMKSNEEEIPLGTGCAIMISQSHGSTVAQPLQRLDPTLMSFQIFLDPISILIMNPSLVKHFMYTKPWTAGQHAVRILSREIGIAHTLQRMLLWNNFQSYVDLRPLPDPPRYRQAPHDCLDPLRCHVVMGEDDPIVETVANRAYLDRGGIPYTWLEGTLHGGWVAHWEKFWRVVRVIDDCLEGSEIRRRRLSESMKTTEMEAYLKKGQHSNFNINESNHENGDTGTKNGKFAMTQTHSEIRTQDCTTKTTMVTPDLCPYLIKVPDTPPSSPRAKLSSSIVTST